MFKIFCLVSVLTLLTLVPCLSAPLSLQKTYDYDLKAICPKTELFGPCLSNKTSLDKLCFIIVDYAIQACNSTAKFVAQNVTCPVQIIPLTKYGKEGEEVSKFLGDPEKCKTECTAKPQLCNQVVSLIDLIKSDKPSKPATVAVNEPMSQTNKAVTQTQAQSEGNVAVQQTAPKGPSAQRKIESPTTKLVEFTTKLPSLVGAQENQKDLRTAIKSEQDDKKTPHQPEYTETKSTEPKSEKIPASKVEVSPEVKNQVPETPADKNPKEELPDTKPGQDEDNLNDEGFDYKQTDDDEPVPPVGIDQGAVPDNVNNEDFDLDKNDDEDAIINNPVPVPEKRKEEEKDVEQGGEVRSNGPYRDTPDSHFFFYFLSFVSISGIGYIAFHNKNKVLALLLEGRRGRSQGRRRPNSAGYRKLDTSLEEAMMSHPSRGPATHVIY